MKRQIFILLFLVGGILKPAAQSTDEYIGNLVNDGDWFTLDEVYAEKKNEIQSDMLKRLSEVMLHACFNRPDAAIDRLDTLLTYHQSELGLENVYSLIALKSRLYAAQGLYEDAAKNCTHFLNQLSAFNLSRDSFPTHLFIEKYYGEITFIPKPEVIRPAHDVKIPVSIEQTGSGKRIYIPVTVKGKAYRFIFDTGTAFSFIPEPLAKDMGIFITDDPVALKGSGEEYVKCGVIDSMQIGNMLFKNTVVSVGVPNKEALSVSQSDAVLGFDFLQLAGEVQLFPKEAVLLIPSRQSKFPKTGRNLMIENNQPYLKCYSGKERLVFHLDAGHMNVDLYDPYYTKHKELVVSKGTKDLLSAGGPGGAKTLEIYRLPQFALKVGKKKIKLRNIPVSTEKASETRQTRQKEDGALGIDFFLRYKKIVLNSDQMFVEIK
jgi:hypothetical protein